jgi:hypothetical protein
VDGVLFLELGVLDNLLDVFLVIPSLLRVAPPQGTLIFTADAQFSASLAAALSLVTLFPSQAAGEAASS